MVRWKMIFSGLEIVLKKIFFAVFSVQRPVRKLFEDHFFKAASMTTAGSLVLDFAASHMKYRRYFRHCRYVGGDIAFPERISKLSQHDIFAQADLNANPFADGLFDVVVSTNCLNYVGDDQESIDCAFDGLLRNIRAGGALIVNLPLSWPHSNRLLNKIESSFKTIIFHRYEGVISSTMTALWTILVTSRKGSVIRKVNACLLRVISTTLYWFVLRWGDLYPAGHLHQIFIMAQGFIGGASQARELMGSAHFFKSPIDGHPLFHVVEPAERRAALAALKEALGHRMDGSREITDVLSDGARYFAVTEGVARLLPRLAVPRAQLRVRSG